VRALSNLGLGTHPGQTILLRRLDHRMAEAVNARIENARIENSSEKRLGKPDAGVNRPITTDKSACVR
jgi:hypothetical protein